MKQVNLLFDGDYEAFDFKYYAQLYANRFQLNGTYQELGDHHIQIRVEGSDDSVESFLKEFTEGPLKLKIGGLAIRYQDPQGFKEFKVLKRSKPEGSSIWRRIKTIISGLVNLNI